MTSDTLDIIYGTAGTNAERDQLLREIVERRIRREVKALDAANYSVDEYCDAINSIRARWFAVLRELFGVVVDFALAFALVAGLFVAVAL